MPQKTHQKTKVIERPRKKKIKHTKQTETPTIEMKQKAAHLISRMAKGKVCRREYKAQRPDQTRPIQESKCFVLNCAKWPNGLFRSSLRSNEAKVCVFFFALVPFIIAMQIKRSSPQKVTNSNKPLPPTID